MKYDEKVHHTLWALSFFFFLIVLPWFGHVFSNKGRFGHKRKLPGFFYFLTCVTSIPFTPCMSSSPKNAWHSLAYHEAAAFQKLRTAPHSTFNHISTSSSASFLSMLLKIKCPQFRISKSQCLSLVGLSTWQ